MSAWIISVGKKFPHHLQIAIEDELWDTTKNADIRSGDDLFFWLSKSGFRLWARATSDLRKLTDDDTPSRWADRETTHYVGRVNLTPVSEELTDDPEWGDVKRGAGIGYGPNIAPVRVPDPAADYFMNLFRRTREPDVPDHSRADFSFASLPYRPGEDLRERANRDITLRQGQPEFRSRLLRGYRSTCAVTGCDVKAVLEAAHIDRYFGDHSHHITNGLLLRSDIHTLFDAQLLTVDGGYTVRIAPSLSDSEYAAFGGQGIHLPEDESSWPDHAALQRHRDACSWILS